MESLIGRLWGEGISRDEARAVAELLVEAHFPVEWGEIDPRRFPSPAVIDRLVAAGVIQIWGQGDSPAGVEIGFVWTDSKGRDWVEQAISSW